MNSYIKRMFCMCSDKTGCILFLWLNDNKLALYINYVCISQNNTDVNAVLLWCIKSLRFQGRTASFLGELDNYLLISIKSLSECFASTLYCQHMFQIKMWLVTWPKQEMVLIFTEIILSQWQIILMHMSFRSSSHFILSS